MSEPYVLPFSMGSTIVELGGGETPIQVPGLTIVNVDKRQLPQVTIVRDLEEDFSDLGLYDGVFAQYMAEHISWRKIPTFFKSCYNILKPDSYAVFVIPDTEEQMKLALGKDFSLQTSQMIYGDQNYGDNSHKIAFSKKFVTELLLTAGFETVETEAVPDPNARDIIVTAYKRKEVKEVNPMKKIQDVYDREYFEDGVTGYHLYRDFPTHFRVVDAIRKLNPSSVLDVGGARGYISKKLNAIGIEAYSVDVSTHCYYTRATKKFIHEDVSVVPWNLPDKAVDLCMSTSFLEHLPEDKVEGVIKEMIRVSKRGWHIVTFSISDIDIDVTHRKGTMKPHSWWIEQFKKVDPNYDVYIMNEDESKLFELSPVPIPMADDAKRVKIQFGSYVNMFHYGWINTDILDLKQYADQNAYIFKQVDVTQPLQIDDDTVDCIVAHHLIEHLIRNNAVKFLKECHRILKVNGVIRVSTPDSRILAKDYSDGNIRRFSCINEGVVNATDDVEAYFNLALAGHLTIHDGESLTRLFKEAGFKNVYVSEFDSSKNDTIQRETIDSFPELSVYIEAVKSEDDGLFIEDGATGLYPIVTPPTVATSQQDESIHKYLKGEISEGVQ